MRIGIIGAGIAGLTAGKKLSLAGHEVTVIEKSQTLGGRLVSLNQEDGNLFDYGISHFNSSHSDFQAFVNYLIEEGEIIEWSSRFKYYDGEQLHDLNPNRSSELAYAAPNGMGAVVKKLSRWVDVLSEVKAGGLTYIGADRRTKRSWMINLTDISVFECDAVVIATPAAEAYAILQTAQDETPARRIIRHIDEINYAPGFTVMSVYKDRDQPEWKAIEAVDHITWITNESSKRDNRDTSLVVHSSPEFAKSNRGEDPEKIAERLLEHAAEAAGEEWISHPQSKKLHFWKYVKCLNPMKEEFLELEMEDAPLALVGDYLAGNTVESAYLSGLKLADYWIQKYKMAEV